jgi:hypothetical protein
MCIYIYLIIHILIPVDCISVWKRTEWVRGRESIDKEYNNENHDDDSEEEEGEVVFI